MKLYDLGLSPNCLKVRAVLNELSLPYERIQVDLLKGEGQTPSFLKMNPNGKVPLLDDNGFFLWESNAIIKYLALKRPEMHLLPTDPYALVIADQWLSWQGAHFYPPIVQLAIEKIFKPMGEQELDGRAVQVANREFEKYAAILDKALEGRSFILGHLSVVDFSLAASLHLRNQLALPLGRYTHLQNWLVAMENRPSWINALT